MDVANGGRLPGLRRRARLRHRRRRQVRLPRRRLDRPGRSELRGARQDQPERSWTVPSTFTDGVTLLTAGGHLHPGGLYVDLKVARDGPDAGEVDGDDPAEVKRIFRSDANYYEPAGAVSWDVAMTVARRDWRIHLEPGDTVSIDATYDVERASWYEGMGILSLGWTPNADPDARDPFEDAAAVRAMYEQGGALTHRRLPENVDTHAREDLKLPDPRKLPCGGRRPQRASTSTASPSRTAASRRSRVPRRVMRPPVIKPGRDRHLHQPGRALRPAAGRSGLAHDHRLPGALQRRLGDRLPAGERPGRLRLRASSASAPVLNGNVTIGSNT